MLDKRKERDIAIKLPTCKTACVFLLQTEDHCTIDINACHNHIRCVIIQKRVQNRSTIRAVAKNTGPAGEDANHNPGGMFQSYLGHSPPSSLVKNTVFACKIHYKTFNWPLAITEAKTFLHTFQLNIFNLSVALFIVPYLISRRGCSFTSKNEHYDYK